MAMDTFSRREARKASISSVAFWDRHHQQNRTTQGCEWDAGTNHHMCDATRPTTNLAGGSESAVDVKHDKNILAIGGLAFFSHS